MHELIKLTEPTLLFGHNQAMEDARDGLTLFGPLDQGRTYGIRAGVIGTRTGIDSFKRWVERIQQPISNFPTEIARPPFPGFEAVFGIPWNPRPVLEMEIDADDLAQHYHLDDKHQRVYKTVAAYSTKILDAIRHEDASVDIWFIIVPDELYKYCRPKSNVEKLLRVESKSSALIKMTAARAKYLQQNRSLFEEEHQETEPYLYEVNFHNQLKARLLKSHALTQIVKESTIAYDALTGLYGTPKRNLNIMQSAIAWNICTAAFYKVGGRPWKIGKMREGVCYIGLVFKQDETSSDPHAACCAAQMFLDSGDGIVFKGAVGPWYSPIKGDYHLSREAAKELVGVAVSSYERSKGKPPTELFIHGKVWFNDTEWRGFQDAVPATTNLVGVRIRDDRDLKLYRKGKLPILRGLACIESDTKAYLWTNGYVPRLQTYPGREVPKPLLIDITRGSANIEVVLSDIMSLTKLNYNTCIFADGNPVTLKFADAVGEILTAGPLKDIPPLPFKHYI